MLYEKNKEKELSRDLFRNPTCEYRGTPFWAWNGKLDSKTLQEQISMFQQMGLGGFHMHVRTGMDSPYLNDEFMGYVSECVERARKEQMRAYLYDEDRWPSGACGGKVTKGHPEYSAKNLLLTTVPYAEDGSRTVVGSVPVRGRAGARLENGELLAVYDVVLNGDGTLHTYTLIEADKEPQGTKWYAYLEHGIDDPWFNDAPYIDTLSNEAVGKFLESTHEVYYERFHEDFGELIPSIFTDEPQFCMKNTLGFAKEEKDVFLPWTTDFSRTYEAAYGKDPLTIVPELLWELPDGKVSVNRYQYHNHVSERFATAFCKQIGDWCDAHGIRLTGHLMHEESLFSQTQAVGDAMRCYPYFGIPGIDILCDRREYETAKQCQSMVHQHGKEGMLSELYGVTGWDCDFRTYKLQGDWQAALGVTIRVPHLAWMTMKGEAKRDYPASIGYQSPWCKEYYRIEDHFSRLNTALTRGTPYVRIGVIHPVESYWLHWGPTEQTSAARNQLESQFLKTSEILLSHNLDFDYICENELPSLCKMGGNPLQVGVMAYDAILVSCCETLRSTTVERLEAFQKDGGLLVFAGGCPGYVDAEASGRVKKLYADSVCVEFDETQVVNALKSVWELEIYRADGSRETNLLYQRRIDGPKEWLFLCNAQNPENSDHEQNGVLRFLIKGNYKIRLFDTMSGEIYDLAVSHRDGNTVFERKWHMHDSLLLELTKTETVGAADKNMPDDTWESQPANVIFGTVPVTFDEPNMYLLDMAEYSLDGKTFFPEEEILRLDNKVRAMMGYPLRRKEVTQPYLLAKEETKQFVTLRFRIESQIELEQVELALEDQEQITLIWNGQEVKKQVTGWYVDTSIEKVVLPGLHKGKNELLAAVPMGQRTNLECMYLLGDFGVQVRGSQKVIVEPVRSLGFGSIVEQGLPFYTGNIRYHFDLMTEGTFSLRVPRYRGALVKVFVDGEEKGVVIFSPYILTVSHVEPGVHHVEIMLYGTRQNGFAQLHHTPGIWFYQSPNSWRSEGDLWSYEYQFKSAGILKSPEIRGAKLYDASTGEIQDWKREGIGVVETGIPALGR